MTKPGPETPEMPAATCKQSRRQGRPSRSTGVQAEPRPRRGAPAGPRGRHARHGTHPSGEQKGQPGGIEQLPARELGVGRDVLLSRHGGGTWDTQRRVDSPRGHGRSAGLQVVTVDQAREQLGRPCERLHLALQGCLKGGMHVWQASNSLQSCCGGVGQGPSLLPGQAHGGQGCSCIPGPPPPAFTHSQTGPSKVTMSLHLTS